MIVGYDPHRVNALAWLSRQALWSLSTITSPDPEAANAIQAVRRLHHTIETGVLAAADDILHNAPLTRSFGMRAATSADLRRRRGGADSSSPTALPTRPGTSVSFLLDLLRRFEAGRLALLSDDELLMQTRTELTAAADATKLVDIDDARRIVRSAALSDELERRAAESQDFADRLVEYSHGDPLLALVVAESDMAMQTRAAAFAATVSAGPGRPSDDHVRGRAVQLFLDDARHDSTFALAAIGQPGLVEGILDWDAVSSTWVELGVGDAVDLVDMAYSSPATYELGTRDEPGSSESTARSLATLVDLMNSPHGDLGLPAELSAAYTAGMMPLLPRLVNGFDGDEVFRLRRDDGSPVDVELGATNESMTDLLGGLARQRDARSMLVGSIDVLGPGVGTLYSAEQFAGFAAALGISMANEQHEEEIHAQRQQARWIGGFDLLESVLDLGGVTDGKFGSVVGAGFDFARWSATQLVGTDDLGLHDAPRVIEMLLVVGLAARVTTTVRDDAEHDDERDNARRDDELDDDELDENFAAVDAQLTRIEEHLASPDISTVELSGDVDLLRDLVDRAILDSELDDATRRRVEDLWSALDRPEFTQPPFRSETVVDLEE